MPTPPSTPNSEINDVPENILKQAIANKEIIVCN